MTDETNAASEKTPVEVAVEHAVEALVYAPIGLLFEGASLLPQLIEKGRNQVNMARMIGKFAVEQGRGEATKAASRFQDQAAGVLDFIGGTVTPIPGDAPAPPAPKPAPKVTRPAAASVGTARQAARRVAGVAGAVGEAVTGAISDATGLAIPDYDGLSASHVVNRLASLSPVELESVRLYEAANRGRKTILSKVAQLQSS
jgi:hypothetical protein